MNRHLPSESRVIRSQFSEFFKFHQSFPLPTDDPKAMSCISDCIDETEGDSASMPLLVGVMPFLLGHCLFGFGVQAGAETHAHKDEQRGTRFHLQRRSFICALVSRASFAIECLSLRRLSEICIKLEHHVVAKKALDCLHRIVRANQDCSFVADAFYTRTERKQVRLLKRELRNVKCSGCGQSLDCKTRTCTCMRATYCNRHCQKTHWDQSHRWKCSKQWNDQHTKNLREHFALHRRNPAASLQNPCFDYDS